VDHGADPEAAEAEAVLDVCGVRLVGEAGVMEDGIEEAAGAVAGEDSAGAVAAVGSGGEAQGQDAGFGVAETGNGPGPVGLVDVGAALALADALAILAKSRTAFTSGDSFMKHCKVGRSRWGGLPHPNRI
jgi:hypothetical protein